MTSTWLQASEAAHSRPRCSTSGRWFLCDVVENVNSTNHLPTLQLLTFPYSCTPLEDHLPCTWKNATTFCTTKNRDTTAWMCAWEERPLPIGRVFEKNESSEIPQAPYNQWRDWLLYTSYFQNQGPFIRATLHGFQNWWMSCWRTSVANTYDIDVITFVQSSLVSKTWATACRKSSWECYQWKVLFVYSGCLMLHAVAKLG
jgi:hypothetical protein